MAKRYTAGTGYSIKTGRHEVTIIDHAPRMRRRGDWHVPAMREFPRPDYTPAEAQATVRWLNRQDPVDVEGLPA